MCSAGLLRSPTIAWVLSITPHYSYNTRAAGISEEYALIPVDQVLVHWADEIVCAETRHKEELIERFKVHNKPVHALDIPDKYGFRDPELVDLILEKLKEVEFTV